MRARLWCVPIGQRHELSGEFRALGTSEERTCPRQLAGPRKTAQKKADDGTMRVGVGITRRHLDAGAHVLVVVVVVDANLQYSTNREPEKDGVREVPNTFVLPSPRKKQFLGTISKGWDIMVLHQHLFYVVVKIAVPK